MYTILNRQYFIKCIKIYFTFLQVSSWRKEAVKRLQFEKQKRPISDVSPPRPSACSKKSPTGQKILQKLDHQYNHSAREEASSFRQSVRKRMFERKKLGNKCPTSASDAQFLKTLQTINTVEGLIAAVLDNRSCRISIEDRLLQEMDHQMASLLTGDTGTILTMSSNDSRLDHVAEMGLEECFRKVPLLYKILATASGDSNKEAKDHHIFAIYCILMRSRSQRANIFQRMLTACCVRHHANNEVGTNR